MLPVERDNTVAGGRSAVPPREACICDSIPWIFARAFARFLAQGRAGTASLDESSCWNPRNVHRKHTTLVMRLLSWPCSRSSAFSRDAARCASSNCLPSFYPLGQQRVLHSYSGSSPHYKPSFGYWVTHTALDTTTRSRGEEHAHLRKHLLYFDTQIP